MRTVCYVWIGLKTYRDRNNTYCNQRKLNHYYVFTCILVLSPGLSYWRNCYDIPYCSGLGFHQSFKFLIINQLDASFSQIYFGMKLYMFRTVPVSIIRSFSLYRQQWYMGHPDPARRLSANLYDIYRCCACSETLLMMDRGTVRNM